MLLSPRNLAERKQIAIIRWPLSQISERIWMLKLFRNEKAMVHNKICMPNDLHVPKYQNYQKSSVPLISAGCIIENSKDA